MDAVVGVLIGLIASAASGITAYWWKSKHDLNTAAAQCYDRLMKLQQARALTDDDQREKVIGDETFRLGVNMDLYLASVGPAPLTRSRRRRYWKAYEGMIPVLVKKDFTNLKATINDLAPLVKPRPMGRE
jgi:hypothetical protein